MTCAVCLGPGPLRHFELRVDGEPLRLQPYLCPACGDAYLLRVGKVLGELLRDGGPEIRESGGSVSDAAAEPYRLSPTLSYPARPDPPVLNKSGGSDVEPPCPPHLHIRYDHERRRTVCVDCGAIIL